MEYKELTDFWEILEQAPDFAQHTANLIQWSTNYDHASKHNPLTAFLILIGYNEEELGEPNGEVAPLGYMELSYLGDALTEYANRPQDVMDYITHLLVFQLC